MSVLVEKLCQQFRQEWSSGRPDLSAFLSSLPDKDRREVAPHLIEIDVSHRVRAGEQPTPDDYQQLLSKEELSRLSDVFSPDAWSRSTGTHAVGKTWIENSSSAPAIERTKIGRYDVLGILGEGAFGTVYRAHDSNLSRDVAIKVPRLGDANDQERITSLLKEAEAAASLSHPNIVRVFDFGHLDDGGCFVVFELVAGGDLSTKIREGTIPVDSAVDLMVQVSEGTHHAHQNKLFHRDLKPANILIDREGRPRITDFGLAISFDWQFESRGEVSGTLAYMSPEQTRGEAHLLDGRSDVWSLGVIFYEMLTGKRPFHGKSSDELFEQIQMRNVVPMSQLHSEIPHDVERVCLRCLQRDPANRYATASDLADALRRVRNDPKLLPVGTDPDQLTVRFTPAENPQRHPQTHSSSAQLWDWKTKRRFAIGILSLLAILGFVLDRSMIERPAQNGQVPGMLPERVAEWQAFAEDRGAPQALGGWKPILVEEPQRVAWFPQDNQRDEIYPDREEQTLRVLCPQNWWVLRYKPEIGEPFQMRGQVTVPNWIGSFGIVWSLRNDSNAFPEDVETCMALTVGRFVPEDPLWIKLEKFTIADAHVVLNIRYVKVKSRPTRSFSVKEIPTDSTQEFSISVRHETVILHFLGEEFVFGLEDAVHEELTDFMPATGPVGLTGRGISIFFDRVSFLKEPQSALQQEKR